MSGLFYNQTQGKPMSGLERLLYSLHTRMQDKGMRLSYGQDGNRMARPQYTPEVQSSWKEMLEREMWRQINQGPKRNATGEIRQQPLHSMLIGRRG